MKVTKDKIDESIYFLSQAEECNKKKDTKGFQYNLESFIAFGKSVVNVLQTEITNISRNYRDKGEIKKYQKLFDWLEKKKNELENDTLYSFFKERRNYILKQGFTKLVLNIREFDTAKLIENIVVIRRDENEQLIDVTSSESSVEEQTDKEASAQVKWTFEDWQGSEDVFTLCRQFFSKLETALIEAKEFLNNL